jgi:hypothetical protein
MVWVSVGWTATLVFESALERVGKGVKVRILKTITSVTTGWGYGVDGVECLFGWLGSPRRTSFDRLSSYLGCSA